MMAADGSTMVPDRLGNRATIGRTIRTTADEALSSGQHRSTRARHSKAAHPLYDWINRGFDLNGVVCVKTRG
jgi:hypothetical protein